MVLARCLFVASSACMAAGLSPAGQPKMRTEVTASGQALEVAQPSSLESAPLRANTHLARVEVQPTGEVNSAPMSGGKRDYATSSTAPPLQQKLPSASIKASADSELDMMARATGSDCNGACQGLQYCPEVNVKSGSYYRKCSGTGKKGFAWKPKVMAKSMNGLNFNVQLYHEENPDRQWHAGTCASSKEDSCKPVKCFSIDNLVLTEDHQGSMCVAIKCSEHKSNKWYRSSSSCKVGFNVKWEQVKIETAAAVAAESRKPSFKTFAGLFLGVVIFVASCIAFKSRTASGPHDNDHEGCSSGDEGSGKEEAGKGPLKGKGQWEAPKGKGPPKGSGKGKADFQQGGGQPDGHYQRASTPEPVDEVGFQIGGKKNELTFNEPPSENAEESDQEVEEDSQQQPAAARRPGQIGEDGEVITF